MSATGRSTAEWLGTGWGLPLRPDPASRQLELVSGADAVRQSIRIILETEPGERIMRPNFGCGLRRYVMKPNTAAVRALLQRDVELALKSWEHRVQVQEVRVEPGDDPSLVLIRVHYLHRRDGSPANLVFPFYLE